jgi:predicted MFS family arabinose efflux permease
VTSHSRDDRMSLRAYCALLLAVFTVSAGYGIALPILPGLVEELAAASGPTSVARHIGALTGLYTFSLFLFAPLWGWLSDQHGRRMILLIGLSGFGSSLLAFGLVESLYALYAERFLSGFFAAAIVPVASAAASDYSSDRIERSRWLARLSMAGIAGFLLGPMLGGFAAPLMPTDAGLGSRLWPLAIVAALSFIGAAAVCCLAPDGVRPPSPPEEKYEVGSPGTLRHLLALGFLTALGLGVFEVGFTVRGTQELGIGPAGIALLFAECSLVMFAAQAVVFSPMLGPDLTRWLVAPLLAVMAVSLLLVSWTRNFASVAVLIGAVAVSAGVLSPALTYWISLGSGPRRGQALGRQSAVASLGQSVGSVAGAALISIGSQPGAPFVLTGTLIAIGAASAFRLAWTLAPAPQAEVAEPLVRPYTGSRAVAPMEIAE